MAGMEKTEAQILREQVEVAELRKQLASMNAPASKPILEKVEERSSKGDHKVEFYTSTAVMKAITFLITGERQKISDEDYTIKALVVSVEVHGTSVTEVIADPATRPHF